MAMIHRYLFLLAEAEEKIDDLVSDECVDAAGRFIGQNDARGSPFPSIFHIGSSGDMTRL